MPRRRHDGVLRHVVLWPKPMGRTHYRSTERGPINLGGAEDKHIDFGQRLPRGKLSLPLLAGCKRQLSARPDLHRFARGIRPQDAYLAAATAGWARLGGARVVMAMMLAMSGRAGSGWLSIYCGRLAGLSAHQAPHQRHQQVDVAPVIDIDDETLQDVGEERRIGDEEHGLRELCRW